MNLSVVVHTLSLCFAVLQSTPCLPSSNTWWFSPTWPSTWLLSGTLGAKRWSWPRRPKTNDTKPQPQLVGQEKTSTRTLFEHYLTHLNTERHHVDSSDALSDLQVRSDLVTPTTPNTFHCPVGTEDYSWVSAAVTQSYIRGSNLLSAWKKCKKCFGNEKL